jgi:HD superfamily phosphohydrolase
LNVTDYPTRDSFFELENKLTVLEYRKQSVISISHSTTITPSLYFVEKNAVTLHYSFMFARHSSMNKVFLNKLDQMISSGMSYEPLKSLALEREDFGRAPLQRLTMNHLGVCFVAILIFLCISFAVFIAECIAGA